MGLDLSVMRPLLEGLLKNMEGGVYTVNLNKEITSFNKGAEWMTGYCLDEVLGNSCKNFFNSDICNGQCPFEKVVKKGQLVNLPDVVIKTKEGAQVVTSWTAFPVNDVHGNASGMAVIIRNKTELKNLKQQLLQSEKLAVIGQLAAGVAHEINNPLNGIITYIHLMLKKLEENKIEPETWKRNLKLIERETLRIARLVKNLLNLSRKSEPNLRPLSPKQLIEETLLLLEDQFIIKEINLVRDFAEGLPNILGDFSQLQQVVINLLLNAIQAVDKKGTVQIKLHAEGAKGSECFVHLHIWDNGVGIPAEDLEKVFDPFYSTKSGKKEGVGLGLSIAKQIIDAHRGRITIHSEVGKGTNVKVRLPT